MSLYSDCSVSSALLPVVTHLLVGHCLHGTSDLYRHLYWWSAAQLRFLSQAFSFILPFFTMCLLTPPILPLTHPHTATPGTLPFSHVISMPVATGYTHTDLKAIELVEEELHVLELKLKALIMDCIHFIDVVQQLLAASTRSTKEWQWQKQLRWECAHTHTHMYICVHVLIA